MGLPPTDLPGGVAIALTHERRHTYLHARVPMPEDKKPKIDLKSRLQKMGGSPMGLPPQPGGSVPAPSGYVAPPSRGSVAVGPVVPPPAISGGATSRPPVLDPGHPLAAVAQPFVPSSMPQAQRIEVDEAAVILARRGGFKGGLVLGILFGGVLLVLGWVGGNAATQGRAREQGVRDAHDLAADVLKAKNGLDDLQQKLDAGSQSIQQRKFPADLAQQLSSINVDFGGDKLFGRRFSGVPAETTRNLFDFITRVQALDDKKAFVVALLNKLEKPLQDSLSRPAGELPISYVVVFDSKEPGQTAAFLAPLAAPIAPNDRNGVPAELTFANPRGSGNVKLPRLMSDKIPKDGAALTVVPNTFEQVCPSATHGQLAQLGSSMNSLASEIRGEKAAEGGDVITETKPGLSEVAAQLADQLNKVN